MGSKNLEASQRVIEGYNTRNWDLGLSGVATNGVFSEIPTGNNFEGHDGFRQVFENWSTALSDSKLHDMQWAEAGDNIYCCFTFSGTNDGEFGGAPATGKAVKVRGVQHFRCKDGLVLQQDAYWDALTMMTQLGHIPAPV